MTTYTRDFEILPGEATSFVGTNLFKDLHGFMTRTGHRCAILGLCRTTSGLVVAHCRAPNLFRIFYAEQGAFDNFQVFPDIQEAVRCSAEKIAPDTGRFVTVRRYNLTPTQIRRKIPNLMAKHQYTLTEARAYYRDAVQRVNDKLDGVHAGRYYVTYFHESGRPFPMEFIVEPSAAPGFKVNATKQTMGEGTVPLSLI